MTSSSCNDKLSNDFSYQHYTYINQIMGDQTVREIITEVFPNPKYQLVVEESDNPLFRHHHVVYNKNTKKNICSVTNGFQNTNFNINDNLCQSYSLLTYFKKRIVKNEKNRQMHMIELYRKIINHQEFIKELDNVIHKGNAKLWIDYTSSRKKYIKMDKPTLLHNINDTLNKWESYGYWYFIGDGTCPDSDSKKNSKESSKDNSARSTRSAYSMNL